MEPVPACLVGRPFTVAEAAAAGVGRRALQGPRFAAVHRGVFRAAETPETFDLRVRGALRVLPDDAALSHQSALTWAGYDGFTDETLHFSTASGTRIDRPGIVLHRRQFRLRSSFVRDVPVLDPARTFVDVATDVNDRALLRIGDWLVRRGLVDLLDLRGFVLQEHLDGVQRARRIAPLVRERVDSVRESDVRWIVWSAGLPVPEPNVPILDAMGIRVAKGDLVYVPERVIVEHDGWHHERDAAQRQRDHLRRERLEALGWRIIRHHGQGLRGRAADRLAHPQRAQRARLPRPASKIWRVEPAKSWTAADLAGRTRQILEVSGLGAGGARGRG